MPPLRRVHLPRKQNRPSPRAARYAVYGTRLRLPWQILLKKPRRSSDAKLRPEGVRRVEGSLSATTDGHGCTVRQGSFRPTQIGRNVTPTLRRGLALNRQSAAENPSESSSESSLGSSLESSPESSFASLFRSSFESSFHSLAHCSFRSFSHCFAHRSAQTSRRPLLQASSSISTSSLPSTLT